MTIRKEKKRGTSDYKEFLMEQLKDPEMAAGYLTACFEEGEETFLLAIKDVAEAQGGLGPLAKSTSLNREGLYAMLSDKGNPRLSSLSTIIDALGMTLAFRAKLQNKKAA